MLICQASGQAKKEEKSAKRKAAQKAVIGWYSSLRGNALSFVKKLFS